MPRGMLLQFYNSLIQFSLPYYWISWPFEKLTKRQSYPYTVITCAAQGEEADWINLNTVQGYRRMVFCEAILDELKLNLHTSGNHSDVIARRVLEAICRNRLLPTTWLNRVRCLCLMPLTILTLLKLKLSTEMSCPMMGGQHLGLVQDYREPLYLRDAPLRIPDTRSEEERKYPEFFRHKLRGDPFQSGGIAVRRAPWLLCPMTLSNY